MVKYLVLAAVLVTVAMPAQAAEYSCTLTAADQQAVIKMGLPQNANLVVHLIVDKDAGKVTEWETDHPGDVPLKSTYPAAFNGSVVAWTIPADQYVPVGDGHHSVDTATNILTTIDPDGRATQWPCSVK